MNDINYEMLPEHMREGTKHYIEEGKIPGRFLTAIFENNLVLAFCKADHINELAMKIWASFIYNEAPRSCWGSPAIITAWYSHQGLLDKKRE